MRNDGLDEAEAGIKIVGRNINNLRYADDTTLMALKPCPFLDTSLVGLIVALTGYQKTCTLSTNICDVQNFILTIQKSCAIYSGTEILYTKCISARR